MNTLFKSAGVGDDGTVWKKKNSGFDSGDATNQEASLEGMHEQALLEERSGKRPRSPFASTGKRSAAQKSWREQKSGSCP